MTVKKYNYYIEEETLLKALILTRGIVFSKEAIEVAIQRCAKGQNLVYNMPINSSQSRPQELIIKNLKDGYETVVSCVSKNQDNKPIELDVNENGELYAVVDDKVIDNIKIDFVQEPKYYRKNINNGESVKKYVSACGKDELNIIPWKGCAILRCCRFCGINNFISKEDISAQQISKNNDLWQEKKLDYLHNLKESISIAIKSDCYKEHAHVILIAGNLDNNNLDYEAEIFSEISKTIKELVSEKSAEGIVAVITPPKTYKKIDQLKKSGISKVVFNLEAITKAGFEKYCPGKSDLGYQFFIDRLQYALNVFGKGNVWTNLVLGLENKDEVLKECEELIKGGIVISANVLHLDKGNTLYCKIPSTFDVIDFYFKLERMNRMQNFKPFYCAKALRTSLSNEAHKKRIREV